MSHHQHFCRRVRNVAVVTLALGAAACLNVTPAPAPSHHFLERSYAFQNGKDTSLMYEGQAAAHIFLVDGLPDAYARISDSLRDPTAAAWRVIVTPMFRIRQLKDSSAAVRTPSFMPRVSLERTWATRLGALDTTGGTLYFDRARVTGARITLAHHSNGQAGCFREGFEPIDPRSNVCRPIVGADTTTVRLNRANGDFSSTFVNVLLHATWRNGNTAPRATWSTGVGIGGDLHVPGLFGALSAEQRELYGGWRLRGHMEHMLLVGEHCDVVPAGASITRAACYLRGKSRLSADYERAPRDPGPLARRIQPAVVPYRYAIEYSHAFDALLRAGIFVRYHDGQDYYNIGFAQRRRMLVVGAVLDASGADAIGTRVIAF
ncbi:MAG: hypothetical protein WD801_12355 [Gemmatimonadaceae bacterium]